MHDYEIMHTWYLMSHYLQVIESVLFLYLSSLHFVLFVPVLFHSINPSPYLPYLPYIQMYMSLVHHTPTEVSETARVLHASSSSASTSMSSSDLSLSPTTINWVPCTWRYTSFTGPRHQAEPPTMQSALTFGRKGGNLPSGAPCCVNLIVFYSTKPL